MACTGAHCSNHGTGTTTCSNHRSSCSTNRPLSLSGDFGVETKKIRASDIENLRVNIRAELSRYNAHSNYNYTIRQASSILITGAIDDTHVEELRKMVVDVTGGSYYTDRTGQKIDDTEWTTGIRTKYEQLRQNCICNSDCACNNVCACHNDCGCNYSDERLKVNIEYM